VAFMISWWKSARFKLSWTNSQFETGNTAWFAEDKQMNNGGIAHSLCADGGLGAGQVGSFLLQRAQHVLIVRST